MSSFAHIIQTGGHVLEEGARPRVSPEPVHSREQPIPRRRTGHPTEELVLGVQGVAERALPRPFAGERDDPHRNTAETRLTSAFTFQGSLLSACHRYLRARWSRRRSRQRPMKY